MASQATWFALCGLAWEEEKEPDSEQIEIELRRLPKLRLLIQLRVESGMVMEELVSQSEWSSLVLDDAIGAWNGMFLV